MKQRDCVARVDIKYVQQITDRHGHVRFYYRRAGVRMTLPGPSGSVAFLAAYAVAEAMGRPDKAANPADHPRIQPRSISALFIEYYQSASFRDLRPSSQHQYRLILDRFRAKHGDKTVSGLQSVHLNAIFHTMASTPHAMKNLRKRLMKPFQLAVRLGWRTDNPVRETQIDKVKTKGHAPWSEADIAAFEAHWPSGSRERLALALLLYTGQRRSDVVTMGRQHVAEGRISVRQQKSETRLQIRIHPALEAEIGQHGKSMTFLMTQYERPFAAAGFTNWFVEKAVDAGLNQRTPHGLRKAAARRLAEAGCSSKQIAAITGHKSLSEVELYTRDADQVRMADQAMEMLEASETRTASVNPPSRKV